MKKVALINDLSSIGKCSLTAAIPILSCMGVQACPLPTAILTNQTDYGEFFMEDFSGRVAEYTAHWQRLGIRFDGIYTGFMTGGRELDEISSFIEAFRREDTFLLVDPVMGDNGALYGVYDCAYCEKMKRFIRKADVITPNLFELCLLTDHDYEAVRGAPDCLRAAACAAKKLLSARVKAIVVTGIKANGQMNNVLVTHEETTVVHTRLVPGSFSGTGDIFSSIICACMSKNIPMQKAVRFAAYFVSEMAQLSYEENTDPREGVRFEHFLPIMRMELDECE